MIAKLRQHAHHVRVQIWMSIPIRRQRHRKARHHSARKRAQHLAPDPRGQQKHAPRNDVRRIISPHRRLNLNASIELPQLGKRSYLYSGRGPQPVFIRARQCFSCEHSSVFCDLLQPSSPAAIVLRALASSSPPSARGRQLRSPRDQNARETSHSHDAVRTPAQREMCRARFTAVNNKSPSSSSIR